MENIFANVLTSEPSTEESSAPSSNIFAGVLNGSSSVSDALASIPRSQGQSAGTDVGGKFYANLGTSDSAFPSNAPIEKTGNENVDKALNSLPIKGGGSFINAAGPRDIPQHSIWDFITNLFGKGSSSTADTIRSQQDAFQQQVDSPGAENSPIQSVQDARLAQNDRESNSTVGLIRNTLLGLPKAAVSPAQTRPLFGTENDKVTMPLVIAAANEVGSRFLEMFPKTFYQAKSNWNGLVNNKPTSTPFDPTRIGLTADKGNVIETSGAKTMNALAKLTAESPNTPVQNALQASLTPIGDVFDAWFSGDVVKTGAVKILEATKFDPAVETARSKLGLTGKDVTVDSLKNQFTQRATNIIKNIQTGEDIAKYTAELNDLGNSTNTLAKALQGKGIPTLSKFGDFLQRMARITLGDIKGNPFELASFLGKPLGEKSPGQAEPEQLPGYRARPGQAPAFGLSTQEVEPVGFGEKSKMTPEEVQSLADQIKNKPTPVSPVGEGGMIEKTPNLRTFDFHEMEGQPQTEAENAKIHNNIINNPDAPMTPGGESFNQAIKREQSVTNQIKNSPEIKSGKNVGIVTHNSMYGLIKLQSERGWPTELNKEFREAYTKQDNSSPTGDHYVIKGKNGEGDIILMRHGETEDNAAKLFRRPEAKLTDKGREQAKDLSESVSKYHLAKIYSSDLPRALETSNIVLGGKEKPSFLKKGKEPAPKEAPEARKALPERPTELKRVTEYKERLKLRGADPVLVDAIITPEGGRAYGVTVGGTMAFEKTVQAFTEDHEIFHEVFQNMNKMRLLKNFDKKALLSEAKDLYGDIPPDQLEEQMALDFQQYVHDQEAGKQSSFFGKILEFFQKLYASFKRLFRNTNDIKELFRTISEGKAEEETQIENQMSEAFNRQLTEDRIADFRANEQAVQKFNKEVPTKDAFNDEGNLTLKTITKLQGRTTVSRQFIEDLTNSGDIKQVERDLIREALKTEPETVNVKQFANKVKAELLPLEIHDTSSPRYEGITLPSELRGNVAEYSEHIYQSPIKTSAGDVHFSDNPEAKANYFGHTRIEDMSNLPEGSTSKYTGISNLRRVIEIQSDLYQKGTMEKEFNIERAITTEDIIIERKMGEIETLESVVKQGKANANDKAQLPKLKQELKEAQDNLNQLEQGTHPKIIGKAKLSQYNDPTAHFRMVREEVKQAAKDGKTKLQFPTGETAMKIEGLGQHSNTWRLKGKELKPEMLEIGKEVFGVGEYWIITDVLGDGKFKASTKRGFENFMRENPQYSEKEALAEIGSSQWDSETFDISGKVDTKNPIYRFYEKDLGRYLKNNYDATTVTDDKGVTWYEIPISKEMAKLPVPAFNKKNPEFNSGDKLKDVRDILSFVEQRVGAKSVEIGKVQNILNREELSLQAAKEAPEAHLKAYGEDRVPKYKDKINELRQRLMDLNKSVKEIKDEYKPEELEKKIEEFKPSNLAPKIRVSGKDVKIPEDLTERQLSLELKKEALENSPYKELTKYIAQSGDFKGRLPEVTGQKPIDLKTSKSYGKIRDKNVLDFIQKGDQIISGIFGNIYKDVPNTEAVREGMDKYLKDREDLKTERKQVLTDIKSFVSKERDRIALEKISKGQQEVLDTEQQKSQRIMDAKREAETIMDWKNFISTYTAEESLPKSLDEVVPPKVRGGIQAPKLNLEKWKDEATVRLIRETMERNLENVAPHQDSQKLKDFLIDKVRENEFNRVEFNNELRTQTRERMKDLGIKRGTTDSSLIQLYGEGQMTLEDLKRASPDNWNNIIKASQYYRNQYDILIDRWNVVRKQFGYPEIPKRRDYFRHFDEVNFIAKNFGIVSGKEQLPTSIAGKTEFFKPGKPFSTAELSRTGNKTKYDAIAGFDNYIDTVSKQIFHIDSIQRGRALERYIEESAKVGDRLQTPIKLPNFISQLREYVNNGLAGKKATLDRAIETGLLGRPALTTIRAISKLIGKNIIVGNLSTALSHLVTLPLIGATTDKIPLIKGLMTTFTAPLMNAPMSEIDGQTSSFLVRRYPIEETFKTAPKKVEDALSFFFQITDKFKARLAVSGKYYEGIKAGKSPDQAMKDADRYAGKVIGDYSLGQRPNLMNAQTMSIIAQFQLGLNDSMSVLFHDIPEDAKVYTQNDDGTYSEKSKKWEMIKKFSYFLIFSYLFNLELKKIRGAGKGLDPIDFGLTLSGLGDGTGKPFSQRLGIAGGSLAGELPFTSIFTGNFPIATSFSGPAKKIKAGDWKGATEDLASLFASPIGGGSQAKKTFEGLQAYKRGYVASPTTGQPEYTIPKGLSSEVQSAIFGPTGSPQAAAFYNSLGLKNNPMKATYAEVQSLEAQGKHDEAQAIVDNLSDSNYKSFQAVARVAKDTAMLPTAQKVRDLDQSGKHDQAQAIVDALSDEDYKSFQGAMKMLTKADKFQPAPPTDFGTASFEGHGSSYGGSTGPDASKILAGNPDDGSIKGYNPNQEPIFARNASLEASRKKEMYQQDLYWQDNGIPISQTQFDHIIPLEAGGTNTADNVRLILKTSDQQNQAFEDYIGNLYKQGKISRADAAKASIDYKINLSVSLSDIESGKY